MWDSIAIVSSGVTLAAFLVAVAANVYRASVKKQENLIKAAPEKERAALVEQTLEFLKIDPGHLTKQQKYEIAIKQIDERANRFRITAIVIVVAGFLAAGVTVYAISQDSKEAVNQTSNAIVVASESKEERQKRFEDWWQIQQSKPDAERFEAQIHLTEVRLRQHYVTASELKKLLLDLGFFKGSIDDDINEELIDAVSDFQKAYSLSPIDGICGSICFDKFREILTKDQLPLGLRS